MHYSFYIVIESTEQSDKLKQSLKEEKQTRKRLESKVDHMEEELNDLKHEKESLERVRTKHSLGQIVYGDQFEFAFQCTGVVGIYFNLKALMLFLIFFHSPLFV